jgi:hypothetical protein
MSRSFHHADRIELAIAAFTPDRVKRIFAWLFMQCFLGEL